MNDTTFFTPGQLTAENSLTLTKISNEAVMPIENLSNQAVLVQHVDYFAALAQAGKKLSAHRKAIFSRRAVSGTSTVSFFRQGEPVKEFFGNTEENTIPKNVAFVASSLSIGLCDLGATALTDALMKSSFPRFPSQSTALDRNHEAFLSSNLKLTIGGEEYFRELSLSEAFHRENSRLEHGKLYFGSSILLTAGVAIDLEFKPAGDCTTAGNGFLEAKIHGVWVKIS